MAESFPLASPSLEPSGRDSGWRRRPMTRRIVALLLAVSMVPLALVGAGAWIAFGKLTLAQNLDLQRGMAQNHARAVDGYLQERLRALEMVARGSSRQGVTEPGALHRVFDILRASYPGDFVDLGVIGSDGQHLAYVGPYDLLGRRYGDEPWFRNVRSHGSFVSDMFLGFRRVPHCVIAVRRLEEGSFWVLRATVNSERLDALVQTARTGKTGDAFLINARGVYQTPARGGRVLDVLPGPVPGPRQGVEVQRLAAERGALRRLAVRINQGAWMLVVQQEEREILADVRQAMLLGGLVVSLAVMLVVITTLAATWHLTGLIERAQSKGEELSRDLMRSARLASLGELSTGLAHEINNPLAILCAEHTNIADLAGDPALPAAAREDLLRSTERCQRQIKRCSNITSRMLQFGRKTESRPELLDPAGAVREVVGLLEGQARVNNVELTCGAGPDLPRVKLDATELQQVLVNLINNSVQACKDGGQVTVRAAREGAGVLLEVQDTGEGIAPEHLERIFLPFFTTKPVGQGTGLGLSVCFGLVQGWGGSIDAQSEPGKGTRMMIHIPGAATTGSGGDHG